MQCPHPVTIKNPAIAQRADYPVDVMPDGSRVYLDGEVVPEVISVPCGKCPICQNARRDMWAARMELETLDHACAWFVTLTYNEESVPPFLCRADLTKFFKRLRKRIDFRYFACGEYGPKGDRPHYHFIAWFDVNLDFDSISELVFQCWKFGFYTCKPANKDNMRYVAKYTVKSVVVYPDMYPPPYATMSRRPGIAGPWFESNSKYFHDFLALPSGKHQSLPRYFLGKLDPVEQIQIKMHNREFAERLPQVSDSEKELRLINLERKLIRSYHTKYGQ